MINEKSRKLAESMVQAKLLSPADFAKAMDICSQKNSPSLMLSLLEQGAITYSVFEKFLTNNLSIKKTMIGSVPLDPVISAKLGMGFIQGKKIYPLGTKKMGSDKVLALGMVDPLDAETIDIVQDEIGYRIIPVLISLPDFLSKVQPLTSSPTVDLHDESDDKVVLIRPGGYEEEIAFQSRNNDLTQAALDLPHKEQKISAETEAQVNQFVPLGGTARTTPSKFIGRNLKKYKEEILAKLELSDSDARVLKKESFTRELLINDMADVSLKPLEEIYSKLTDSQKLEALANALIKAQIIKKHDILVSGAVSYIFGDD